MFLFLFCFFSSFSSFGRFFFQGAPFLATLVDPSDRNELYCVNIRLRY